MLSVIMLSVSVLNVVAPPTRSINVAKKNRYNVIWCCNIQGAEVSVALVVFTGMFATDSAVIFVNTNNPLKFNLHCAKIQAKQGSISLNYFGVKLLY